MPRPQNLRCQWLINYFNDFLIEDIITISADVNNTVGTCVHVFYTDFMLKTFINQLVSFFIFTPNIICAAFSDTTFHN